MNIGEDMFVLPCREGTEPRHALAVSVDVAVATDIIAVRTATSENNDVQLVRLEIFALRSVLHDGKPASSRSGVLGEKHLGVLGQPVDVLMRVDDLAALRLVFLDPRGKGGIFQIAHADHAISDASRFAELAEDNAVLAGTPRIGSTLSSCRSLDVGYGRGGQFVQLCAGNCIFDSCNGFQPCAVVDTLLSSEAHALTAFLEAMAATIPLDSTVVKLPAAFTAGMPARLP